MPILFTTVPPVPRRGALACGVVSGAADGASAPGQALQGKCRQPIVTEAWRAAGPRAISREGGNPSQIAEAPPGVHPGGLAPAFGARWETAPMEKLLALPLLVPMLLWAGRRGWGAGKLSPVSYLSVL